MMGGAAIEHFAPQAGALEPDDLAKLVDTLSQRDPIELDELVRGCNADELGWLAKEFERRAWRENEVAFALRRILIDRT